MKFLSKLKNDRQDLISNLCENIASLEKIAFEQQAEIERLQDYIENLRCINTDLSNNLLYEVEQAKSEAIKEFAERLKNEFEISSAYSFAYIECQIDNLVKEMVGEENV